MLHYYYSNAARSIGARGFLTCLPLSIVSYVSPHCASGAGGAARTGFSVAALCALAKAARSRRSHIVSDMSPRARWYFNEVVCTHCSNRRVARCASEIRPKRTGVLLYIQSNAQRGCAPNCCATIDINIRAAKRFVCRRQTARMGFVSNCAFLFHSLFFSRCCVFVSAQ